MINAAGMHYRELNVKLRELIRKGEKKITIDNVNGQRYIGAGISSSAEIVINGVPGNDLGVFMDGLKIEVNSNCQDATGNTMNAGKIIINGDAGDVIGYAMRNGKIFVKGDVGYRVGIHMKEYKEFVPVIIAGGSAGDFLGEYMAGGIIILLNLNNNFEGDYIGTGMHGGVMYIRGEVAIDKIGEGVGIVEMDDEDSKILKRLLKEYCEDFGLSYEKIIKSKFIKLKPITHRPYGDLYCY